MIKARVITGLPGSGKTELIMREMAMRKARCVFATSRTDLLDECAERLRGQAEKAGTSPVIHVIHGKKKGKKRGLSVRVEIADAARLHEDVDHVVLFITHEGMMGADLSEFVGWHITIDENPAAISSNALQVPATAKYLAQAYDLVPLKNTKWSKLVLKPDAPSAGDVLNDDLLNKLATFDKRARSSQGVYVDVHDWATIIGSRRRLKWWSAWTPAELGMFASVTIAGAGFFNSLCYKATLAWFSEKVSFTTKEMPSVGRACPQVAIHYFTQHRGSTTFWATQEGEDCLLRVSDHLRQVRDLGYWSANTGIRGLFSGARIPGVRVSPKLEGTNALIEHTSCALIYSSKALPGDGPALEAFGLAKADVDRAREQEDIIQFSLRGALRRPDFGGTYSIYLYSLDQAQMLADYLGTEGLANVQLVPIEEAGIMDVARVPVGRPKKEVDEATKAQQQAKRRAKDAERKRNDRKIKNAAKKKAGTYRERGRPRREENISRGAHNYRETVRHGLTPQAWKNRYAWKEDLYVIREREAAEAGKTRSPKRRDR